MKVGILTYHDTTNYGAVLQAYALQQVIEKLGQDCDIIDYKCPAITNRYRIKKWYEISSIKELVKHILTKKDRKTLKVKFNTFNNKYQKLSNLVYVKDNIKEANAHYESFVVGSDQVWNLSLSGEDMTYFLDFVSKKEKKNSYAASFGYTKIPTVYQEQTIQALQDFSRIAVREVDGKRIIKENLHQDVEVVLDPTLLLQAKDWEKLISKKEKKKEYILVYTIAKTPTLMQFAKTLAKEQNCDVIYLNHSYKNEPDVINIKDAGPEEFLWYIQNAKSIVTSSFHGVVFSINLEKDFYYELSKEKMNFNSRIESMVSCLGLKDCEIKEGKSERQQAIAYDKVTKKLEIERQKSMLYLSQLWKEEK